MLWDQLSKSQSPHFQNDLARYSRVPADQTYDFLLKSMDRFINEKTLKQNRQSQENEFKNKIAHSVTPKSGKGKTHGVKRQRTSRGRSQWWQWQRKRTQEVYGQAWAVLVSPQRWLYPREGLQVSA